MVNQADNTIRFQCGSGHRIKANARYEGTIVLCPSCRTRVLVPLTYEPPPALSESGAMRLINECEDEFVTKDSPADVRDKRSTEPVSSPRGAALEPASKSMRKCPRCRALVDSRLLTCSSCNVLLSSATRGFRNAYRAALRAMAEK